MNMQSNMQIFGLSLKVRRLNRKRKLPTERSTNVKMPRVIGVKDERVAAETLLLLSEPSKEVK